MKQFLSFMWLKELTSYQTFPISLFLKQLIQSNNFKKSIFQLNLSRNLWGPVISRLKKKDHTSSCMNRFWSSIWMKDLIFCQKFPIFLFLEQIIQSNNLNKAIIQLILSRNLEGPLISQRRKGEPKELLYDSIFVFYADERFYFL